MSLSSMFGGGGQGVQRPTVHSLRVSDAQIGVVLPVAYGRFRLSNHLIWLGDFTTIKHKGPGKGLSGAPGGYYYTYTASMILALCLGPIQRLGVHFAADVGGIRRLTAKKVAARFTLFTGALGQSPWSYMTSAHPGQALGYTGIAYVAKQDRQLGTSAQLPQDSWEVFGALPYSTSIPDAEPSQVITDMIQNATFGMAPGADWIDTTGSFANFRQYCIAYNFFISPTFDQQRPGREWLKLLAELVHAEFVWSEGQLRIVPYPTSPASNNGVTWTPATTPVMTFDDDDYLSKPGEPPISVKIKDPASLNNVQRVEYIDVTNDYNINTVEWMDESDAAVVGTRRAVPRQYHPIPNGGMAMAIAQLKAQWELYVDRTYTFKVPGARAALLDPMDVIAVNDIWLGLTNQPLRIVSIDETGTDQGGQGLDIQITAEDIGPDTTPGYPNSQPLGPAIPQNSEADPPIVNTPVFMELPFTTEYEVLVAVSGEYGNLDWGGANVYLSQDGGQSFAAAATVKNPATMGVLLAALPTGSDPDTVNTLSVDLTESAGELSAIATSQADIGNNLAYVDGELIAFANVAAGAQPNQYNLTYLRRGLYGTAITSHAAGANFVYLGSVAFLDDGIAAVSYPPNMVGVNLVFEFASFNLLQGAEQDLSDTTAYTYAPNGPNLEPAPNADPWQIATSYPAGSYVTNGPYTYIAIVGGTSGGAPPAFPNQYAGTVTDNGIVWQNIGLTSAQGGVTNSGSLNDGSTQTIGTTPVAIGSVTHKVKASADLVVISGRITGTMSGYDSSSGNTISVYLQRSDGTQVDEIDTNFTYSGGGTTGGKWHAPYTVHDASPIPGRITYTILMSAPSGVTMKKLTHKMHSIDYKY